MPAPDRQRWMGTPFIANILISQTQQDLQPDPTRFRCLRSPPERASDGQHSQSRPPQYQHALDGRVARGSSAIQETSFLQRGRARLCDSGRSMHLAGQSARAEQSRAQSDHSLTRTIPCRASSQFPTKAHWLGTVCVIPAEYATPTVRRSRPAVQLGWRSERGRPAANFQSAIASHARACLTPLNANSHGSR